MTTKTDATLPWEKSKDREGYTKFDVSLDLGEPHGVLAVRRQRPNGDNPGKFTVYLNDQPITGRAHDLRPPAQAEAERILYTSDQFRESKPALVISALVQSGRDAFMSGVSVYSNPYPADKPVTREHWLAGWLEAFANSAVEPLKVGIDQTTRAFNTLQGDYEHVAARLGSLQLILAFGNGIEGDAQRRFFALANAGDVNTIRNEFPGLLPVATEPVT